MRNVVGQIERDGQSRSLDALLAAARLDRRARMAELRDAAVGVDDLQRRRRALALLERMLSGPLPEHVDCSSYLNRLASRRQVASRAIGTVMTRIEPVLLGAGTARALAVAVSELFDYVEIASFGTTLPIHLAIGVSDGLLIVGMGAVHGLPPLATCAAHRALLRARAITLALGGEFQRGVDGDGIVFGMTFPWLVREDAG